MSSMDHVGGMLRVLATLMSNEGEDMPWAITCRSMVTGSVGTGRLSTAFGPCVPSRSVPTGASVT